MNERIKELALQAGLLPKTIGPVVETRHMKKKEQDLEKFAELLVRECADISEVSFHNGSAGYLAILNHFGVEQ